MEATGAGGTHIRYELIRMVMVDSYTPGRITELPLAGGTALTGRNGRGKTSLLKLIPAFYGERPDKIVKPVSNQQTFARYYLPRASSYIVYEYRRDDALCCVVLCADQSGDAVHYRFVTGSYQREWFVHDDGTSLVANTNLAERLKQCGAPCSRKMPLEHYRAIIQGKRTYGSDQRQHQRDVLAYAFCPSGRPLSHIERIVSGMFTRKTNFLDLQRMVVASVTDATGQISLGTDRKKVESWPEAYQSYDAVMAEAWRMQGVESAYNDALAAEEELRHIYGRFVALDGALQGLQLKARMTQQQLRDSEAVAEQRFGNSRREIEASIDQAKRTIAAADANLRQLNEQEKAFKEQEIEEKAAILDREHELSQAKDRLEARRALVLNQQSHIDGEYSKLISDLNLEESERLHQFELERSHLRAAAQTEIEGRNTESEQLEAKARQDAEPVEQRLRVTIEASIEALGVAKALERNPQADADLIAMSERQEIIFEEARARFETISAEAMRTGTEQEQTRQLFDKAELQLSYAQIELAQAELRLEALLRRIDPDPDSLLHFLRTQRPEWTQDIAKVVREDILTRTDLAPFLADLSDSIYGLHVNLDALDLPSVADDAALQSMVDSQRAEIGDLQERVSQLDAKRAELGVKRNAAQQKADLCAGQAATVKVTLQSAEKQFKAARQEVTRSMEAARHAARQTVLAAQQASAEAKAALQEHQEQVQQALELLYQRRQQANAQTLQRRDAALAGIDAKEVEARAQYQSSRQQIDQERKNKLQASGVDTAALEKLDEQIATTQAQLRLIQHWRNAVNDWRRWQSTQWSQRGTHESSLAQATQELAVHERTKLASLKAWQEECGQRASELKAIAARLQDIDDQRSKAARHLQLLEPYAVETHAVPSYDPAWQLATLVGQANTQQANRRACEEVLSKEIAAIKRVFTASRLSPPDQYFETNRKSMGPDRAEQAREWVPVFKAWYNNEHHQCQNLLRVEAKMIAEAVADFRNRMESFHRRIQQFNRELQESLSANQGFESIEELSVEIVSSIRELEYWSTIEKVIEQRSQWQAGELIDLPPPGFALALRDLLSHWHLKEGIQAELIGLVRIQGEVVENGTRRPFRKAEDLENISSNGLSYIITVLIFVGFINRVRAKAPVNVVWSLDEIKDLDLGNVELLMEILKRNDITLVSACPDPDPDVLALFANRRSIKGNRYIYDPSGSQTAMVASARTEEASV